MVAPGPDMAETWGGEMVGDFIENSPRQPSPRPRLQARFLVGARPARDMPLAYIGAFSRPRRHRSACASGVRNRWKHRTRSRRGRERIATVQAWHRGVRDNGRTTGQRAPGRAMQIRDSACRRAVSPRAPADLPPHACAYQGNAGTTAPSNVARHAQHWTLRSTHSVVTGHSYMGDMSPSN